MNYQEWSSRVMTLHPDASITKEDGSGKTYGELDDYTAHTGPDMQADVVGTLSIECDHCWVYNPVTDAEEQYDATS